MSFQKKNTHTLTHTHTHSPVREDSFHENPEEGHPRKPLYQCHFYTQQNFPSFKTTKLYNCAQTPEGRFLVTVPYCNRFHKSACTFKQSTVSTFKHFLALCLPHQECLTVQANHGQNLSEQASTDVTHTGHVKSCTSGLQVKLQTLHNAPADSKHVGV